MVDELKKKLFDFIHELPQKQKELEEVQQHCHAEHLSKQELLAENESLKVEASNLRAQLDFTNKVLHKCEENLRGAKDAAVKNKLGLEASSRISDKMKEEATRLHSENMALKKQLEQLEKETKTESFFRESCIMKQTKIQATIESLTNQMRDLDKNFKDVERKSNTTLSVGNKSKLVIENKDHIIKQLQEKIQCLSEQNINLTSEIKTLKLNENGNKPVEQHYVKEILKEWQSSVNEMKNRLQSSEKEIDVCHITLERSLQDMKKFQESEQSANEKVRELEAQLEEVKRGARRMCTDCSIQTDLPTYIEVGSQTTSAGVNSAGTQTDYVHLQEKDGVSMKPTSNSSHGDHNVSACSYSTSAFTPSLKYSSSAVSELISRLQKERTKQDSEETKTQLSQSQE